MPPRKRGHQRYGENSTKGSKHSDSNPAAKPIDGKVKEFGKKARALLQEEKDKRREIKVVDKVEVASNKANSRTSFGSAIKSAAVATTKKRPNKKLSGSSPAKRRRSVTSKIHSHAPHIPIPDKEFRSNIVKLHGLHPSCTVEHVKKFFSGLKIDFAFTVLSNDVYIPLLDCKKDLQDTRGSDISENYLRVFVKFESSTLATVAAERSGETIDFGENEESRKLAIGVTLMTKELGRRMLEMVSFTLTLM